LVSAKGVGFTLKPGAAPQDYGNPKAAALKARFTPAPVQYINGAYG